VILLHDFLWGLWRRLENVYRKKGMQQNVTQGSGLRQVLRSGLIKWKMDMKFNELKGNGILSSSSNWIFM